MCIDLCHLTLKQGSVPCLYCFIHVAEADWLEVPGKSATEAMKVFQQYWKKSGGQFISLLNMAKADPNFL